jgi:two-component system, cell cycle response regulator DivK
MKRIVYVEDNDDNAFMLQARLELEGGYEVLVAVNGTDGLAMVANKKPDLVLMDLNLPDIDGWEVARRLKADPATAQIAIIALTAHAMSGDRETALASGCDEFDTKPVDLGRLLQKMTALLDRSA